MDLTHIIRTFRNGLNGELLERHLLHNDLLQRLDGSIDGTITRRGSLKLLTADVESNAGNATHTHTRGDL